MKKKNILFFFIFFLVFSFSFTQASEQKSFPQKKIKIISSVFPLQEFAKYIVGERGEVNILVPPGAEIHTWQPKPSDIIRLSSADVFIYIGASLEPWIQDVLKSISNPSLIILETIKSFDPLIKDESIHSHDTEVTDSKNKQDHEHKQEQKQNHEHSNTSIDPHIWLDFIFAQKIIDKIERTLSTYDPEGENIFKSNAQIYKKKLKQLDKKYRDNLSNCRLRSFIVGGHAAFGLLAKRYNLEQIALYGLSPDSKPTPKQLIKVVELAKKYKIKIIYFESFVSDELARVVAKEIGAETQMLNAGANITKHQLKSGITFLDIMEKNLEKLKDGLVCR